MTQVCTPRSTLQPTEHFSNLDDLSNIDLTQVFSRKVIPTPASGLPSVQACQRKRVFRPRRGITPAWRHSGWRRGSTDMRLSTNCLIPPCRLERESRMLALHAQIQIYQYRYERRVPKQNSSCNLNVTTCNRQHKKFDFTIRILLRSQRGTLPCQLSP